MIDEYADPEEPNWAVDIHREWTDEIEKEDKELRAFTGILVGIAVSAVLWVSLGVIVWAVAR